MATKVNWPTHNAILSSAAKCQNKTELAQAIGANRKSLSDHLTRQPGLKAEVEAALEGQSLTPNEDASEIEKLKAKLSEAQSEIRKRRKADVFTERVSEACSSAIAARRPEFSPKPIPKRVTAKHEMVLLWSDLHAGEVVTNEETGGINEYDYEIMLERHERLRQGLFSFIENRPYPIEKLHVLALGDMLSGEIHEDISKANEMPLAVQTVQVALDGAAWLRSLAEVIPSIEFSGVVGNHPRFSMRPSYKDTFNNADWIAYDMMQLHLKGDKRFKFDIPKAAMGTHMVCGRRIYMMHGDDIRTTMPGVPWGGVVRRCTGIQNQFDARGKHIDAFVMGHFHTRNLVSGPGDSIIAMNGSIKGADGYGIKRIGAADPSRQLLLTFNDRHGWTDASSIDLQDPPQ